MPDATVVFVSRLVPPRARRPACATITPPSASPPPSNASAGVSAPRSPSAALNPPPESMPNRVAGRALTTTRPPGRNLPSAGAVPFDVEVRDLACYEAAYGLGGAE